MPKGRHLLVILFSFLSAKLSWAKEATVFDVRRPLAMENNEVPPKDYYINAGESDGLKKGMLLTIIRRQSLYDQYHNKSPGDLVVEVGELRIIHTQSDISVARLAKISSRENLPTVDFEAIMVGDKVDLLSAKMAPQKTASLETAQPQVNEMHVAPTPAVTVPVQLIPATLPQGSKDMASSSSGPL